MRAVLEFNLPDDSHEYEMCINAGKMASALSEFSEYLRREWKYSEKEHYDIEEVRDKFYECMTSNGVNTDVF